MKVRNRILNIFLAVMLVFTTLLSTNKEVFATTEQSAIDVKNDGNGIVEVKDNEGNFLYKLTKTIKEKDNVSKKATVTIGAEGGTVKSSQSTDKSIDIVLIADTSGSMEDNGRIGTLKKELKETFKSLKQLEDSNAALKGKIRVGLISFSDKANDISGGLQNINYFTSGHGNKKIDSLEAYGATYTDAALSKAKDILKSNNTNEKIVVLMTDGAPTYSTKIRYYNKPEFYNKKVGNGADYELPDKWYKRHAYKTEDGIDIKNNGHAGILRAKVLKEAGVTVYTVGIGADEINFQNYLESIASTPDKFYRDASNMSNFSSILKNILYKEISNPTISDETLTDIMGDKVNLISSLDDIKNSINVSVKNNDSEIAAKRKAEIKKAIEDNLKINNDTITIEKITLAEGESFTIKYDIEPDVDKLAETDYGKWLDANQIATLGQKVFPKPQIKVFMPELEIIKLDAENNKKLENAEFSLYKNGNLFVPYKMTQNGYVNINGKITTDSNGRVKVNIPYGQYNLKETKAPKDYLINKEEISLNVNDIEIIREVKNTAIQKVQYSAQKIWQNAAKDNQNKVDVTLYAVKAGNKEEVQKLTITGNAEVKFDEVNKYGEDGEEIKYTVEESNPSIASQMVGNPIVDGTKYIFTNKVDDSAADKVQYSAQKIWQNAAKDNQNKVDVTLYAVKAGNKEEVQKLTITGNAEVKFDEVNKYGEDGEEIKYTVEESNPSIASQMVGNPIVDGTKYIFTNKVDDSAADKVQYSAQKIWQNAAKDNQNKVDVTLYAVKAGNKEEVQKLTITGNAEVKFDEVNKYGEDGEEIKYTVEESNPSIASQMVGNPIVDGTKYIFTNKVDDSAADKVQYSAQKIWQNAAKDNQNKVDVTLYAVKAGNKEEVQKLTITGNAEVKFDEVNKYGEDGEEIKYTVEESNPSIASQMVGNPIVDGTKYIFTNKVDDSAADKVQYSAQKIWQNAAKDNQNKVDVTLYAVKAGNKEEVQKLTITGNAEVKFDEVNKYGEDGEEIKYTVEESNPSIASQMVGNPIVDGTKYIFTNKVDDSAADKVQYSAQKIWQNAAKDNQNKVDVTLYAVKAGNKEEVQKLTITGNAEVKFDEVNKYGEDGEEIKYTVEESNPSIASQMVGNPIVDGTKYIFTNKVDDSAADKVQYSAQKIWQNAAKDNQNKVDVTLYAVKAGNKEEVQKLTITGNAEVKFDEVNKYGEDGEEIKYTVEESNPSIASQMVGNPIVDGTKYIFTNKVDDSAADKVQYSAQKIWQNAAKDNQNKVDVTLYAVKAGNKEEVQKLTITGNAEVKFDEVNKYGEDGEEIKYTVEESNPSIASQMVGNPIVDGTKYIFTNKVDDSAADKVQYSAQKIWQNAAKDNQNKVDVTLYAVKAGNKEEVQKLTITGNAEVKFDEVNKYGEDGEEIKYTVEESNPSIASQMVGNPIVDGTKYIFTNKVDDSAADKVQYSAQKIWQNAAKDNQNKVDVTLYAVKAGNKEEVQKLTITGNAEVKFDEVNKYGEDGEEIKYTVEESNPSIASQMVGNPIVDGTKYIFTNKVDDSAADKVQYSAQKIWQNAAKDNQNKVDVTLYAVKAGNKEEVQKLTITGNAEVKFDEVNKYGEDGEEIKYTVEESNPSIASQMVGNPIVDGTKYIFTNKVDDSAADKVQYSAQKIWQNAAKDNQNKVDVTLYAVKAGNKEEVQKLTITGNAEVKFDEVNKYGEDGEEIKYTVEESNPSIASQMVGNPIVDGTKYIFTNKVDDSAADKVQYSAQKIWQNAAKDNQNKVDVTLYAVKAGNKEEVQKLTITGNAEVKFDEVNKYGEDGEEIKYTVEESNPSIASQMVGNPIVDGTKYIFTNKVDDSAADKVQYSAQKIWQNAAKDNQNKVDVTLYAVKAGNKEEVQKLTITGNAEVKFDEVNKYGEDGEEIKYTVEESNPSIASQMVGNPIVDGTKYIFTNKVDDSAADKVQYSAQKIWQNAAKDNQNKVDVTLYAVKAGNKEEVQKLTITGNAEVKFDEVNKYGEDGEEIKYTVEESNPSIASQMVGNPIVDGTKYIFTNKVDDSAADKVQYSVEKKWKNVSQDEKDKYQVKVKLYQEGDNTEKGEVIIQGEGTGSFEKVLKFDENNQEIKYVVKEVEVTKDGVDVTDQIDKKIEKSLVAENLFILTNQPKDPNKLIIKVTKEWLGVEDPSNLTAKIHLLENGDDIDNGDVKGNNSVTFTADKFDSDGNPLTLDQIKAKYTISETNIPEGYKLDSVSEPSMDENGVVNYTVKNIVDGTVYRTLVAEKQWLNRDGSLMSDEEAAKYYQVKITVSKLVNGNITALSDEEVKGNLTITGNGKIEFKVPARDEQGNFIKYYLSEKVTDTSDRQVSYIQRTEDIKDPENKDQIQGLYGVKFINQLQDLTIKKLDGSNNNQPLQGIDFTIVKDNDMISGTTNSDGVLVSNDSRVENGKISLSEGDYTVSETNAENMGYKATTPVTLRVTTGSILIVNKDENGNEIGTTLLPNGVLKITDYSLGSGENPKVEPEDKQDDPTPVPDPNPNQPGGNSSGGDQPGGNPQDPNQQGGQQDPNPQGGDSGDRDRDRDNEPRTPRINPQQTVTVNDDATPLSVPDTGNNGDADTVTVDEETTPLSAPNADSDELEEITEDEVPLSLPKTGSQDNMLYVILGMAMAIFGIKKFRK